MARLYVLISVQKQLEIHSNAKTQHVTRNCLMQLQPQMAIMDMLQIQFSQDIACPIQIYSPMISKLVSMITSLENLDLMTCKKSVKTLMKHFGHSSYASSQP